MSVDKLQERIRKLKNPSVVDFNLLPEHIPPHIQCPKLVRPASHDDNSIDTTATPVPYWCFQNRTYPPALPFRPPPEEPTIPLPHQARDRAISPQNACNRKKEQAKPAKMHNIDLSLLFSFDKLDRTIISIIVIQTCHIGT